VTNFTFCCFINIIISLTDPSASFMIDVRPKFAGCVCTYGRYSTIG